MLFDGGNSSKQKKLAVKFIYNFLSLQKQRQLGNTLTVAVCLGLVAIGGTTASLMKASKGKTNAVSDEMTKQAIAAAEAGLSRIQGFLAQNPQMAMVDNTIWATVAKATISTNAQIAADAINKATSSESATSSSSSSSCVPFGSNSSRNVTADDVTTAIRPDLIAQVGSVAGTNFSPQNIGENSDTNFRLISYTPPSGVNGGTGTLVVRGQYKGSSEAQLEVKLPVKQVPDTNSASNTSFNGKGAQLWAQNFTASGGGNHTINLAIVADSPDCFSTPSQAKNWEYFVGLGTPSNAIDIIYGTYNKNVGAFPSLPGNINTAGNEYSQFTETNAITSSTCISETLPRTADQPISGNVYAYNMPLNCAVTFDITGGKTVKVFSNDAVNAGRVNIETQTYTTNQMVGTPDSNLGKVIVYANNGMTIGGNARLGANNWKYYQFYIANGDVFAGGNSDTAGFIFAPNSTVNYKGTSSHFGPIWARTFALTGGGNGRLQGQFTTDDANYLEVNLNTGTSMTYSIGSPSGYQRTSIQ